jgi:hypothetical protein
LISRFYDDYHFSDGYRQDCSGMVSMSWKTSTAGGGHTTRNMLDICHKITRSELKKGDALLKPGEHVLLFDCWVDSDHFMVRKRKISIFILLIIPALYFANDVQSMACV